MAMSPARTHLRVNPIRCDAYGYCAELLPELISLDEWGYPIIAEGPVPRRLARDAQRAVSLCPRLALLLEARDADAA
jgi:ferredoxin